MRGRVAVPLSSSSFLRCYRPSSTPYFSFHTYPSSRSGNPWFALGALSASREGRYLSKAQGRPRTEYAPHLELIRRSEVDPFVRQDEQQDGKAQGNDTDVGGTIATSIAEEEEWALAKLKEIVNREIRRNIEAQVKMEKERYDWEALLSTKTRERNVAVGIAAVLAIGLAVEAARQRSEKKTTLPAATLPIAVLPQHTGAATPREVINTQEFAPMTEGQNATPRDQHLPLQPALPVGWEMRWSKKYNKPFFIDHNTRTTTWKRPTRQIAERTSFAGETLHGFEGKGDELEAACHVDCAAKEMTVIKPHEEEVNDGKGVLRWFWAS